MAGTSEVLVLSGVGYGAEHVDTPEGKVVVALIFEYDSAGEVSREIQIPMRAADAASWATDLTEQPSKPPPGSKLVRPSLAEIRNPGGGRRG